MIEGLTFDKPARVNLYEQRFKSTRERFMEYVEIMPSGCWEWKGRRDTRGAPFLPYGYFWLDGKTIPAHRAAWLIFKGPIADGLKALHVCDNPGCVNYETHLFLGTSRDNTQDMMVKGRKASVVGELHGQARLNEDQVRTIYHSTDPQAVTAEKFGISQTMVSRIKLRKAWSHVAV